MTRILVVGCGSIGQRHIRMFRELGGTELAAVDPVEAKRDEVRAKYGLRALYRTLELPGANPLKDAHTALDANVLAAYGFAANKDLLAQLLALNLEVAKRIEAGKPVTPPGVPKDYRGELVTNDCIQSPAVLS